MATTTFGKIAHRGETWDVTAKFTEDDGSTAYAITRMCTGHWAHSGQWVPGWHRVYGTVTEAQYRQAAESAARLRAAGLA